MSESKSTLPDKGAPADNIEILLFELKSQGVKLSVKNGKLLCQLPKSGIDGALKAQLVERKEEIKTVLEQAREAQVRRRPAIAPRAQQQDVPLSFSQQRLWLIDQLQGHSNQYNMPFALEVNGQFDVDIAVQALNVLVERHQVLSSVYLSQKGQTVQHVNHGAKIEFTRHDLSQYNDELTQRSKIIELATQDSARSFDLTKDVMIRASWLQLGESTGVLLFNMHHIASDGWSFRVLIREFSLIYEALSEGRAANLPPLPVQYADYALWQRDYLSGEVYDQLLTYWKGQLTDVPVTHALPLDKPRSAKKADAGATFKVAIPPSVCRGIAATCQKHRLTPFMLLHAAFSVVLCRYGNSPSVAVGTPVANRVRPELEPLIGFFVNTLVLHSRIDPNKSIAELFEQIKMVNEGAQRHQDFPFEQLVEQLNVPRDGRHSPLFQIMLSMDNISEVSLELPKASIKTLETGAVNAKFDIELAVRLVEDEGAFNWIYDDSIFSKDTLVKLNDSLQQVLAYFAAEDLDTAVSVGYLPVLSRAQVGHLCNTLNQTEKTFSEQKLIHEFFAEQVQKQGDSTALVCGDERYTYAELSAKVNRLAHWLRAQGVSTEQVVGVYMERSTEMVVALMAIVSSGGAYVPLDPDHPVERITTIIDEAKMSLVLSQKHLYQGLQDNLNGSDTCKVVAVDAPSFSLDDYSTQTPERLIGQSSRNLAYVIYTSGSTGKPKGVMIEHQALVNRIEWMNDCYPMSNKDKVLQKTPFGFDVSVWEFFWTLGFGGTLVMAKPQGHKDPLYLSQLINKEQVSVLHFVPSMLNAFLSVQGAHLGLDTKVVFCSGEALNLSDVSALQKASPHLKIYNLYGPTEAAIDVSSFDCADAAQYDSVPIGKPIQNIALYVLDKAGHMVPQGTCGELYIGGVGLARGYLNNEQLTQSAFAYHQMSDGVTRRLYKTGDWVRLLSDGNIEYLHRIDKQVKLRGLRIELGEIEVQLNAVEQVDSACALVSDVDGRQLLVAYVKPSHEPKSALEQEQLVYRINARLQQHLPSYMVPDVIEVLNQWPQSANGKIDVKRLPKVTVLADNRQGTPAKTETERQLCQLWAQHLGCGEVAADVNFFSAGGTSLLLIQLVQSINQHFEMQLTVVQMFEHTTVQMMAKFIDGQKQTVPGKVRQDKPKRKNLLANRRKNKSNR